MAGDFGETEGMDRLFGSTEKPVVPQKPKIVDDIRGVGGMLPSEYIDIKKAEAAENRRQRAVEHGFEEPADKDQEITVGSATQSKDGEPKPGTESKPHDEVVEGEPISDEEFKEKYGHQAVNATGPVVAAVAGAAVEKVIDAVEDAAEKKYHKEKHTLNGPAPENIKLAFKQETPKNSPEDEDAEKYFREEKKKYSESLGKRSFMDIQNELISLEDLPPNKDKESALKLERGRLTNAAKAAGVFDSLQQHMLDIQDNYDFGRAMAEFKKIDIDQVEADAKLRYHDWDDKMLGMLGEYRDVALLNMELAYQRAAGNRDSLHAKKLERKIDLRSWGLIPVGLEASAKKYIDSFKPKPATVEPVTRPVAAASGFDANAFREAMGQPSVEQQRELYLKAEGQQAAIPIDIIVPGFLLSGSPAEREIQQNEWKARARLSTAANFKMTAPSFDKSFPNQAELDLTRENLHLLLSKEGVFQTASAYVAIISGNLNLNQSLGFGSDLPNSFFDLNSIDSLQKVRDAMQNWLVTNYSMDEGSAREAEQIAWNLIYLSDVVEEFDSGYNKNVPEGHKRIPPISSIKSLPIWMMMHPQERLKAKVNSGESWSVFGEYASSKKRGLFGKVPEILPRSLFTNVLKDIKVNDKKVGGLFGLPIFQKKEPISLFSVMQNVGNNILANPIVFDGYRSPSGGVEWKRVGVDWGSKVSEGPFSGHLFDSISPAIKVFGLIQTGEWKGSMKDLADSCRKLNLGRKDRETLLKAIEGIDPKANSLKAQSYNALTWRWHLGAVQRYTPSFFK